MPAAYKFVDRWFVPFPIEDVYDVIGAPLDYPKWWGDVFPEVEDDDGPPRPGRRNTITARAFLPYKLHFVGEVTSAERPRSIEMKLEGDFEGGGAWSFEEVEGGTAAVLDWRPIVQKAGVSTSRRCCGPSSARITTGRCAEARSTSPSTSRAARHSSRPGRPSWKCRLESTSIRGPR